jgi:TonB family protein
MGRILSKDLIYQVFTTYLVILSQKAESGLAWHWPCIFPLWGFLLGGGTPMRKRLIATGLGLALLGGGLAVTPRKLWAQEAQPDEAKRKVRAKVMPEYPALAKQMNVTGKVKIEATIAADGHVLSTRVVGGSPLLVNAALAALKQWRFEPSPKDTTEVIEFEFNGQ